MDSISLATNPSLDPLSGSFRRARPLIRARTWWPGSSGHSGPKFFCEIRVPAHRSNRYVVAVVPTPVVVIALTEIPQVCKADSWVSRRAPLSCRVVMVAHDAAFLDRAEQDSVLDCYDVLDRLIGEVEVELFALLATVRPDRPINFDRLATLLAQTTGEPPSSDQSRPASRTCVASSATAQTANHSSPIAEHRAVARAATSFRPRLSPISTYSTTPTDWPTTCCRARPLPYLDRRSNSSEESHTRAIWPHLGLRRTCCRPCRASRR
jgi:hypothetical protein